MSGALGTGTGKWRLSVTSEQLIEVMSLLSSPTGHLTNLSTVRGKVVVQRVGETAAEVFREYISEPIVQTKCVNCHVEGGQSGHTRLVFVPSSNPDHETHNLQVFKDFLTDVEDRATYILNKIQGVAHGGGMQVPVGTPDYENMERFLRLLGEDVKPVTLTPQTLFDTVQMAPARKTLRRAALIFAGRTPSGEEYAPVQGDAGLRETIRDLMTGPEFHEFLIRASNDRLLTDRDDFGIVDHPSFVDFSRERYRRRQAAHASGDDREYWDWYNRVQYGARRAPLELVAHVVENDLPYTEILTADYIMANPWAAAAYGAPTHHFEDSTDFHEFEPSSIETYYRQGDEFVSEYDPVLDAELIIDPGPLNHGLSARGHPQYDDVPPALPHDGDEPQPGALSLDLLPLPRSGHREVRIAHHRPGGARGHEQPDDVQSGLHRLPPRARPRGRRIPELRRGRQLQGPAWRRGFTGWLLQGSRRTIPAD